MKIKDGATALYFLVMVVAASFYLVRPGTVPTIVAGTSIAELDSLTRYLQPVGEAPELENYEMFLPARESLPPDPSDFIYEPPPPRRLSAIMVIGGTPVAIMDDRTVREGDVLSAGTEVVRIETSGVTLRERDGSVHTVQISRD